MQASREGKSKRKIVLLGDRYLCQKFEPHSKAPLGFDFQNITHSVEGVAVRLQLWDTAGQERYRSLIPNYLKDADAIIYVFDISEPSSLEGLNSWISLVEEVRKQGIFRIAAANKCDLQKRMTDETLLNFNRRHSIEFVRVSALSGEGVYKLIDKVVLSLLRQGQCLELQPEPSVKVGQKLSVIAKDSTKVKKKCC